MKETEGLGTRSKPRSPPFVRGGAPFTTWQGWGGCRRHHSIRAGGK